MRIKVTASIIALLLPLIGLILLSREGSGDKVPPFDDHYFLKKLSIEKFDKKVVAPDFTLKDLNGKTVSLRDLRGKVVFLNFWATWCPPCKLEMPKMEELHKELSSRGLVILAINFQEGPQEIREFFKEHNLTFTALLDRKSEVFGLYQAWSLPTTYLINRNGEIVGKVIGYRDWHSERARNLFHQLLEDSA
jgi:peroxiredoxin